MSKYESLIGQQQPSSVHTMAVEFNTAMQQQFDKTSFPTPCIVARWLGAGLFQPPLVMRKLSKSNFDTLSSVMLQVMAQK